MPGIIEIDVYAGINIEASIGPESIHPVVVVGRKLCVFDRTGIGGIRRIAGIVAWSVVLLLIHWPVARGQSCRDEDELDAGGLLHSRYSKRKIYKCTPGSSGLPLSGGYRLVIETLLTFYPH